MRFFLRFIFLGSACGLGFGHTALAYTKAGTGRKLPAPLPFYRRHTNALAITLRQLRPEELVLPNDSGETDSSARKRHMRYDWKDSRFDATSRDYLSPMFLPTPPNVVTTYEITPDGKGYYVYERVGDHDVRSPSYITREEYQALMRRQANADYFRRKATSTNLSASGSSLIPRLNVNSALFRDVFGSGAIDIRPNLTVLMDLSIKHNSSENPALNLAQQSNTFFDFKQQIQMNVVGTIGERLRIRANYDTQATFNFENQFKVEYVGTEDDILRHVEAGNVSLPLGGSLIQGANNLWGIKMGLQFGPVTVTAIASQQRGKTAEIIVKGGTQQTQVQKSADDYDDNRHFFLNHFFRSQYENSLRKLPVNLSRITVTRVEVYVKNINNQSTINNRNAVGLVDLGENDTNRAVGGGVLYNPNRVHLSVGDSARYPKNNANDLYRRLRGLSSVVDSRQIASLGLTEGQDFELISNMRQLQSTEYTLQPQLGYINLNTRLQDNDVLFVAYQYQVAGSNLVYQVGEFSTDKPSNSNNNNALFLKLLKRDANKPDAPDPNNPGGTVTYPAWDLMMKNIYSLGGYNLQPNGFIMNIVYQSTDGSGDINYIPDSLLNTKPLIQVLGVDQLNNNNELGPDNRYDFVQDITIDAKNGLLIFPVLEPFNTQLAAKFAAANPITGPEHARKYTFPQLYRLSKWDAQQNHKDVDRFNFKGYYSGSLNGSDVSLNAVQIVPGSVKVTANGGPLAEGTDYIVNYDVGKVTILNQGILSSGQEIHITYESNTLFGIDQKTLVGARVDYRVNKHLFLGSTILHYNERPLTDKVFIGQEPMSNTIYGVDGIYSNQSNWLTRALNKLPFYQTKTPSFISVQSEYAQLLPGEPGQISNGTDKGIAYIDDFDATQSAVDFTTQIQSWVLASRPSVLAEPAPFPGPSAALDSLRSGFRRGKLAWYTIDSRFYDAPDQFNFTSTSPALNSDSSRRVSISEVYPNKTISTTDFLPTFDLHFFPNRRGPYNYQYHSPDLLPDGTLANPDSNWAGIMRRTTGNTNFEASNYEYIEFWLMDPTNAGKDTLGKNPQLVFNLGDVSEDILPDGQRSYENGLPGNATDDAAHTNLTMTAWGYVPNVQVATSAFSNDVNARPFQDVGFDGLTDNNEKQFFATYLNSVGTVVTNNTALNSAKADPSSDNFAFFTDARFNNSASILDRYANYNGPDGNAPILTNSQSFATAASTQPDVEDINRDGNLNTNESYWQYRVSLSADSLKTIGKNYVVDKHTAQVTLPNGSTVNQDWYQFRIPLTAGTSINQIKDFQSINFFRMYLTKFHKQGVLRFATLRLVATQWRTYGQAFKDTSLIPLATDPSSMSVGTVDIEQNSTRAPFNYVVPPGITRQGVPASVIPNQLQNEAALQIKVNNLQDQASRMVFKSSALDLRFYKHLKMFVHAEKIEGGLNDENFNKGDATVFMRIGSDFTDNYYEYELPLAPTTVSNDPYVVWADANSFDFDLETLTKAKEARNATAGFSFLNIFTQVLANGQKVSVRGNPQLNFAKVVAIGLRNRSGKPLSMELWANELRATDFDQTAGWAATARVNLKLADLGSLSLAFQHSTPGFGSVQSRIGDRTQEYRTQYDIALGLQLGKLLPKKLGLEIPFFFSYGEREITPKYNPLDQDVLLTTAVEAAPLGQQAALFQSRIDYSRTYSYSFNNVRKVRVGNKKLHFWSLENFAFSYGYSEQYLRNAQIENQLSQTYHGGVSYTYNINPHNFQPFKGKKGKVNLLTAFNFYLLPQSITYSINGQRLDQEQKLRNESVLFLPSTPTYTHDFTLNRTYSIRWDLTRSLGFTFGSSTFSRVDEPNGALDTKAKRDTVWNNFFSLGRDTARHHYNFLNMGRTLNYQHNLAATYRLPFDKVKQLDFLSSTLGYNVNYRWTASALQTTSLGNTLYNDQIEQFTGQISFQKLYKKFPFIARLLKPIPKKNIYSKNDTLRKQGDEQSVALKNFGKFWAGILFSVQNLDVNYTQNRSSLIPGYLPHAANYGLDYGGAPGWDVVLGAQPTLTQDGWFGKASRNGWISRDTGAVAQFLQTKNTTLNARTTFALFKGCRVDLTLFKNTSESNSGLYAYNYDSLSRTYGYHLTNQTQLGQYSISFISLNTAFGSISQDGGLFSKFLAAAKVISKRLYSQNPLYNLDFSVYNSQNTQGGPTIAPGKLATGYYNGYTNTSQDVLISAFLSTYGPYSAKTVGLNSFPQVPLPNWQIAYDGLTDVWFMKQYFKTVRLTSSYKSTYSVNYSANLTALDYNHDGHADNLFVQPLDTTGGAAAGGPAQANFQSSQILQSVLITENFAPLIGINLVWKNGMSTLINFNRNRQIMLNVGGLQLTEMRNNELTLNVGWRLEKGIAPFQIFGRIFQVKNTIAFRFETTLRDSKTINRRVDNATLSEPTAGNFSLTIKPSVDYSISTQLTFRAYIERNINRPVISTSFPTSYTNVGIQLRLTIGNGGSRGYAGGSTGGGGAGYNTGGAAGGFNNTGGGFNNGAGGGYNQGGGFNNGSGGGYNPSGGYNNGGYNNGNNGGYNNGGTGGGYNNGTGGGYNGGGYNNGGGNNGGYNNGGTTNPGSIPNTPPPNTNTGAGSTFPNP